MRDHPPRPAPAPAPQRPPLPLALRVHLHVTSDACEVRSCDWSGYHLHWRGQRLRSVHDGAFDEGELVDLDLDCARDVHDASAWRDALLADPTTAPGATGGAGSTDDGAAGVRGESR